MSTDSVTIVGLTGGIATGKSTVSKMFRELGAHVIDADVVAREVVEPGTSALAEIREAFGDDVISDDGTLDRAALGDIVFNDEQARRRLGAITHPRIGLRMMELANAAHDAGHEWVLYDAALLIENGIHEMLPATIVVACSPETQLDRLKARDDFDDDEARARIGSQLPIDEKVGLADYVIDNDGPLERTRQQVARIHEQLDEQYRQEP